MVSGVVGKESSHHSWSGGKWQKRREKKGGGGGSSLDSSEFGFGLLGVMVRVARFVSEGVLWSRAGWHQRCFCLMLESRLVL